ncbi:MAG: S8 family serine peptidase, partial [Bacillota bacterium]
MRSLKRITTRIIAGVFCLTSIFASGVTAFADSKGETAGYKHFYEEKHKKWSETENKEIIVKYKDEEKGEYIKSSIQKKLSISSFKLKNRLRKHQIEVLEIGKDDNIDEVIEEFKNNSGVEYVQPNYKLQLFSIPNDPEFRGQWGLFNLARIYNEYGMDINVLPAWDLTMGSSDVIVGVIDTGIDINHPDLSANIYRNIRETANNGIDDDGNGYIDDIAGWDFYSNDNTVFDSAVWDAHGTHVAGIISAASNGQGVVGVAPNVKILPLKIGDENEGLDTDKAIAAIDYAESLGVKIINCSWGSYHNNPALYDRMRRSDIIFVCAVGNDTCDINYTRAYPAGFDLPNVISVAAVDSRGSLAEFSNYGSDVDVAAPGVDILSTLPDNSYGYMDGTSMSAPFVAGVCALLKSYYSQASNTQILNRLKENVVEVKSLKDKVKGLLDAGAAFDNTNKRIAVMSGYIPSGLDTSVTDNSITLSWDSIEGVNSYEVEIDREVTKTVTEATYYIHEELTPGSIHMFRVRSKIEGPQPTWSEAVIGSTLEPGMGTGLLGEYYDNMNFSGYYGAWIDETVNFDWNAGAPGEYMENDTFSVRWTGYVEPKYTEEYTFYANAGDGIRLWIDGQLIIDDWRDKGITESAGTISLNANHKYNIRMEYYESLGVSKAQLWWSSQTQQKEIVPKEHLYPSKEGGRWSSKTNMPTTRFGMGVTELNGEIYVAGGMLSSGSIINTVEKYNPVSDIWSASPGLSTQSAGGSLASLNGKLYAVGGFGPDIYDNLIYKPEIYEYHPGSQSWNHLSTLSSGRASMATAVLNDRIYVIGGENEYDYLNNLDVFDPVTRSCIPKASMPTSRSCLTAAVVNGKIYAIGGLRFDNTGGYILNTVEEYDPVRDVWTQKSSMMIPRMAPSAAVVNGKIYVMGGVNPVLGSLGIVEEYDPLTDTWSLVESMPT